MRINKQYIGRIFLCVQLLIFSNFYFFGTNGINMLNRTKRDIMQLEEEATKLKNEVVHLQSTIALQKKHPFFQEKIAREQLQMARANEEIYLIND